MLEPVTFRPTPSLKDVKLAGDFEGCCSRRSIRGRDEGKITYAFVVVGEKKKKRRGRLRDGGFLFLVEKKRRSLLVGFREVKQGKTGANFADPLLGSAWLAAINWILRPMMSSMVVSRGVGGSVLTGLRGRVTWDQHAREGTFDLGSH